MEEIPAGMGEAGVLGAGHGMAADEGGGALRGKEGLEFGDDAALHTADISDDEVLREFCGDDLLGHWGHVLDGHAQDGKRGAADGIRDVGGRVDLGEGGADFVHGLWAAGPDADLHPGHALEDAFGQGPAEQAGAEDGDGAFDGHGWRRARGRGEGEGGGGIRMCERLGTKGGLSSQVGGNGKSDL